MVSIMIAWFLSSIEVKGQSFISFPIDSKKENLTLGDEMKWQSKVQILKEEGADLIVELSVKEIPEDVQIRLCFSGFECKTFIRDIGKLYFRFPKQGVYPLEIRCSSPKKTAEVNFDLNLLDARFPNSVVEKKSFSAFFEAPEKAGNLFRNHQLSISKLYPNPASQRIFFDYSCSSKKINAKVVIYDLLGNVISEHSIDPNANRLNISLSNLRSGIYFYQLHIDNKPVASRRFAKNS